MNRTKKKPGRNERCPCGSGNKYKRCCLNKDRANESKALAAQAATAEIRAAAPPPTTRALGSLPDSVLAPVLRTSFTPAAATVVARGGELPDCDVHPWVVAQLRHRLGVGPGGRRPRITIAAVRAMETERIVRELAAAGVTLDVAAFGELAAGYLSAWALSETWGTSISADPEFVGLAACELWRRILPERPSLEMLDELMQEGYDALESGNPRGACKTWLHMWDALLAVLPADIKTVEQADAFFPGLNSLGNHLGDLQIELYNAALDSADIARQSAEVFARLAQRFATSRAAARLRRELAEFLHMAGEQRKGEAILEQLIAEDPDDPAAYVALADLLSWQRCGAEYRDVQRAIELLERALARPVRDAEAWDLRPRLEDLRSKSRTSKNAG